MTESPQESDGGPMPGASTSGSGFLDRVREIAHKAGYAIAVHGSQTRDLDLIAVPWTIQATSRDELVQRLCEQLGLLVKDYADGRITSNPEQKPHGRLAWALVGCPAPWRYVDLSVTQLGDPWPILPRQWPEHLREPTSVAPDDPEEAS